MLNFPTRFKIIPYKVIDNIFIHISNLETYIHTPLSNGLSDHEAPLLEILYTYLEPQNQQHKLIRKIDHSMADFVMKLSYETLDTVLLTLTLDLIPFSIRT
jgi:hypothetical protein